MKPNLKLFSISDIDLSGDGELPADIIQRIRTASPPDNDGDSVFYDLYKIDKNSHVGWIIISSPAKDGKTCHLLWHYHLGKARKPRKNFPLIDEALEILAKMDNPIELACSSTISFTKRDKVKTILNLPLVISESPNLPFDEVRGLHLSKIEGKGSKYDVILDRNRDGSLTEAIFFRHTAKINSALIDDIINKFVEISKMLIFKEK